jgi:hypothetical protein
MSSVSDGIARYLLESNDPELKNRKKVSGNTENYMEYELEFLRKETEEAAPKTCLDCGIPIDENCIRKSFFTRRWRC